MPYVRIPLVCGTFTMKESSKILWMKSVVSRVNKNMFFLYCIRHAPKKRSVIFTADPSTLYNLIRLYASSYVSFVIGKIVLFVMSVINISLSLYFSSVGDPLRNSHFTRSIVVNVMSAFFRSLKKLVNKCGLIYESMNILVSNKRYLPSRVGMSVGEYRIFILCSLFT